MLLCRMSLWCGRSSCSSRSSSAAVVLQWWLCDLPSICWWDAAVLMTPSVFITSRLFPSYYLQVSLLPSSPTVFVSPLSPWKVCVCSVGSPVPVHYPTSLHNDPRVLPEPVASLRASHCSPVFYLLDNGKRRGVSWISASSWTPAWNFCLSFFVCVVVLGEGIIRLLCDVAPAR